MEDRDYQQAKTLLDDFNSLDTNTQDKLLNGVKCLAFLYDLADTRTDNGDKSAPTQPV